MLPLARGGAVAVLVLALLHSGVPAFVCSGLPVSVRRAVPASVRRDGKGREKGIGFCEALERYGMGTAARFGVEGAACALLGVPASAR